MNAPVSTRRTGGRRPGCWHAAPRRKNRNHTLPADLVKSGSLSWLGTRLPDGFMTAVTQAFLRPCRIWNRGRDIRFLLEVFNQPEAVLPLEVRSFLRRLDELD